jgi:sRNA-binding regulator protein Hfq
LGHADLEQVLFRKRLEAYRATHQPKTCLEEQAALVLSCFGGMTREGVIQSVDPYCVGWRESGSDDPLEVHKLEIKFAYAPRDASGVGTHMVLDTERSAHPQPARKHPQDRYNCSDRRLFRFVDEQEWVRVTLLEGETFEGLVRWFSRYELEIELKDEVRVVIFRHALAALTAADKIGEP